MKNIILLFFLFCFTLTIQAKTVEIIYSIADCKIRKAYQVIDGPSIIPISETRRLTQKVIRITEIPESVSILSLLDKKIDMQLIPLLFLVFANNYPNEALSTLYSGPDGRYINFETRKYQEGLLKWHK